MPSILVKLPSGQDVEFPEGVSEEQIKGALSRDYPQYFATTQTATTPPPTPAEQGLKAVGTAIGLADTAVRATEVGLAAPSIPEEPIPTAPTPPSIMATTAGGPQVRVAGAPGAGEQLRSEIVEGMQAPIVDLAGMIPRPDGRIGALLRTGSGVEKFIAGGATGTAELVEGVANFMLSAQGMTELALTKTPLAPAVALKWAKDMVEGGMISSGEAYDAYKRGDMEAFGKHVAMGVGQLAGAGGLVAHQVGKAKKLVGAQPIPPELQRLAPQTAAAVAETAKPNEPKPAHETKVEPAVSEVTPAAPTETKIETPRPADVSDALTPESIAQTTGFTYDAGMEAMVPNAWHFTDKRPDSPTRSLSVAVAKGSTPEQVQAAIDAKVAEGFTPPSVTAPPSASPPTKEAAVEPTKVGEPTAAKESVESQIRSVMADRERAIELSPKPTTKQEAMLEGDPFLEGQTKWDPVTQEAITLANTRISDLIQEAVASKQPIPEEITDLQFPIPEGYVLEGNRYVFKPQPPRAENAPGRKVEAGQGEVTLHDVLSGASSAKLADVTLAGERFVLGVRRMSGGQRDLNITIGQPGKSTRVLSRVHESDRRTVSDWLEYVKKELLAEGAEVKPTFSTGEQRKAAASERAKSVLEKEFTKRFGRRPTPTEAGLFESLKRSESIRYKTAGDEKRIDLLKKQIEANPDKWNEGDGVGWKVSGDQINRGFRIVSVDPEAKTVVVRQVADTGLTSSGGNFDVVKDTTVRMSDLVRDKKYDTKPEAKPAPKAETPKPTEAVGPSPSVVNRERLFYATSNLTGTVEVVRDFVQSANMWEVRFPNGDLQVLPKARFQQLIEGVDDAKIAEFEKAKAKASPKPTETTGGDVGDTFLAKHGVKTGDSVTIQISTGGKAYPATVTGYSGEGKISVRLADRAPVPKVIRGQERTVDPLKSNLALLKSTQSVRARAKSIKEAEAGGESRASITAREAAFDDAIRHDPEFDPPSAKEAEAVGERAEAIAIHARKMSARKAAFKAIGLLEEEHSNPVAVAAALPKLQRYLSKRDAPGPKLAEGVEQGDLIAATQREDLSLAGETGIDIERIAAEKKAKAEAAKAAAEFEAKNQQQLFGQGPGARTRPQRAEPEPPETFEGTGLKHAIDELERIGRGFKERTKQERQDMAEAWERTGRTSTPEDRRQLEQALIANPHRGLTGDESAQLLRRKVEIKNALNDAAERSHSSDPQVKMEATAEFMRLEKEFNDLLDAVAARGSDWGREGRWRQALADEDFTFESRSQTLRVKKGEPLSHEEIERLRKQTAEDADTIAKYEAYITKQEAKLREAQAGKVVEELEKEVERDPVLGSKLFRGEYAKFIAVLKKRNTTHREKAKSALSELASLEAGAKQGPGARTRKGVEIPNELTARIVAESKHVGAEKIAEGLEDPRAWDKAMLEEFGPEFEPFLKEAHEAAVKQHYDDVAAHFGAGAPKVHKVRKEASLDTKQIDLLKDIKEKVDAEKPEDVSPLAQKLAKIAVAKGARGWRAVAEAVHKELRQVLPGLDFRDTLDMISGYGRFKPLDQDAVKVAFRQAKQEMQAVRKIQDVVARKPLKKTGFQFQPFNDVKRRLIAVLNEAKKKFGVVVTNPEAQLKSALDARKKFYDNRIADLTHEIKTRQKIVRERNLPPTDAELQAKISEYKRLRSERDEIFKGQTTPEQQMRAAIKALERSEIEYRRRREAREFTQRAKEQAAYKESPEYQAAEARRDAERAAFEEMRDLDEAFQNQKEKAALERQKISLLKQIHDRERRLAEGPPTKEPRLVNRPAHPEIEPLLQQVRELDERIRQAEGKTPEERALAAYQTRLTNRAAEQAERLDYLRSRLESGEITEADLKRAKREPMDLSKHPELAALKAKSDAIRQDILRAEREAAYAVKSPLAKAWYRFQQTRGAIVNIKSSFDFSAPRQALAALLSNSTRSLTHPGLIGRPFADMFKSWWSEENAGRIEAKRKLRPNAQNGLDKAAGIEYSDLTSEKFTRYEENAHSILDEWAALPWRGKTTARTIAGAPIKAGAKVVRMSNRAFIAFLNSTRAELFDHLLKINFKDLPPTEVELKAIGNLVNVSTGRGKMNPAVARGLTEVLWAPKLLASRIQLLAGQPFYEGSGRTRLIAAKEYARILASGTILAMVASYFDDDENKPPWSMTSSDLGKIRRGETTVDLWGGFQQPVVLGSRFITGERETRSGKTLELTGPKQAYGESLWLVAANFARSKLRPDVGAAVDLATRSNFLGEPWTPGMFLESTLVPLPVQDVADLLRDRGIPEGLILQALQEFGAGVQVKTPQDTYKPSR